MGLSAKRENLSRFLMLSMASLITFISWSSLEERARKHLRGILPNLMYTSLSLLGTKEANYSELWILVVSPMNIYGYFSYLTL